VKHITYTVGLCFTSETVESYLALSLCGLYKGLSILYAEEVKLAFQAVNAVLMDQTTPPDRFQKSFLCSRSNPTDKSGWLYRVARKGFAHLSSMEPITYLLL